MQVSVPPPQRTKTSSGKLLALTLLSLLLLGLPILSYPLGGDEAMFAIAAETLMRGQHLYLDIWDLKPPAIYLLYAGLFSIGGVNATLIWCFDLAWTLLTCFLIYLLGSRMYNSGVGLVAAFAYGTAYFPYDYANMAQTDSFMVLPIVAAIYFAYRSRDGHSGSWMFAAGLMLGLSFWLKYTGVVFVPIVVLVLLWPKVARDGFFGKVLAGIAGFLLVAAAFLAYIFFNGIWSGFIATLAANTGYNNYGFGGTLGQAVTRLLEGILLFHIGLWLLALVPLIKDLRSGKAGLLSLKGSANLLLWLWLVLAFAALLIQQKLYPYQWIPMLAPLSLITARGFFAVLEWPRWSDAIPRLNPRLLRPLLLVLLLLIVGSRILKEDLILYPQFIAYSTGLISESEYALNFGSRASGGSANLDRITVAHAIVANTQPDQKILVWGYVPEIYWLANRQPASRFAFNYPLVAPWYPGEWKQEFMNTITANPPAYFIIVHDDYIPYQSGRQEDSAGQLKYVPGLTELLNRDYIEETRFNDMSLYRHK